MDRAAAVISSTIASYLAGKLISFKEFMPRWDRRETLDIDTTQQDPSKIIAAFRLLGGRKRKRKVKP